MRPAALRSLTTTASVLLLVQLGCDRREAKPAPVSAPHALVTDIADPDACASCHDAIVAEWRDSMHARAHHSRDPIYAGVRALRIRKEGAAVASACARCHTPGFEIQPDAPGAAIGVACASCHNALVAAAPGQLLGPNDVAAGATQAHATGPGQAALADGTSVCLVCHAALDSPQGVSMCATGAEHAAIGEDARSSCASCHMPRAPGPATTDGASPQHASHTFLGPHRAWYQGDPSFAASAVAVEAAIEGDTLRAVVRNVSGHAFPTGFPGRQAIVRATGYDAAGAARWHAEPTVLGKVYVDAAGAPTLAPYAAKLASDTRIGPAGEATLEFELPPAVARVELLLELRLLPAPLAAKLGLADAVEAEPRTLHRLAIAR